MSKTMRAIGLMSGTSMDGIDVALIETDGENTVHRRSAHTVAYDGEFRAALAQAIQQARDLVDRNARPGILAAVEREVTERHAGATKVFLARVGLQPADIDVVGFHGQTVLHVPDRRLTVQLGDGPLLAKLTGIDVVYDLRAADCAAGGQGAPLGRERRLVAGLRYRPGQCADR